MRERSETVGLYLERVRRHRLLDRESEGELAERSARGCVASRRALVESNLAFVVRIAKEYRNLGVPFEDLLEEGNLGLLEAACRFDGARGTRFITYASWWIRKAILDALVKHPRLVRLPYYQLQRRKRLLEAAPEGEEVPRLPGFRIESLDEPHGDGERTLGETIADATVATPEEETLRAEATFEMRRALEVLNPQERRILELRFGLDGSRRLSLNEVGAELRLSRERIRQLEGRAIDRLRRALRTRSALVRRVA